MTSWFRFLFAAIAAVAFSLATCDAAERTVTYKKVGDVELQLHIFEPAGHQPSDSTPAIVFFFGGGWVSGTPSQFIPHCEYLASRGMVAISAEYRTKSKHGTSPVECVADGKSAVRWVRQHAKELGIDPLRIAAGGGSAGGHVAAATGTLAKFDEASEDAAISSRPNALLLFNPVFDNGPQGYGHDRVKEYWQDFSPLHNLSQQSPPTIVFLGSKDNLIPVATAADYKKRMEQAGVRCDVWIYPGQPHGFFNARGDRAYFHATVYQADKFLASLGYLEGEPTIENTKVEAEKL